MKQSPSARSAARLMQLATRLAQAPEGHCCACDRSFSASESTANISRCFCSENCERQLIRAYLKGLSFTACKRIIRLIDSLLQSTADKIV